jgi:glyoxylase-like metal-dependent hydrolase (beta-lactamase superfamily II)
MKLRLSSSVAIAVSALVLALAPATGRAETKLTVQVFTASEPGFLVDSVLVSGVRDAILIDAQFTLSDAHRLIAMILESKKDLKSIYVTHLHPDHYFGLVAIKQAFPKATMIALPSTIAGIKKTWAEKINQWTPIYGANLPGRPLIPTLTIGKSLTLEGQTLEVHGGLQGDAPNNSYVWIPSIKTAITGDIVYHGVHPWTAETNTAARQAWVKTLDELGALGATTVVAGHKDPRLKDDPSAIAETRAYLKAFDEALAASKSADELEAKLKAQFPGLALPIIAHFGAAAQFPAATAARK